jgi:hypothetical protein
VDRVRRPDLTDTCGNDFAGVHLPHRSQVTSLLGTVDRRILEAVNSEGAPWGTLTAPGSEASV